MSDLNREVGEIHTKVDNIINLLEPMDDRLKKTENKVEALRRWQAWIIGIFTSAGAGVGATIHKIIG